MKLLRTLITLCLFTTIANAQFVTNSKRVADVYFQNKEYYAAAEYYKKALQISSDSLGFVVPYGFESKLKEQSPKKDDYEYCVLQLAESLRLYKNFDDAEKWYEIAKEFIDPKYVMSNFWYAETLRANQKYKDAIDAFNVFLIKHKVNDAFSARAKSEITSCEFALHELRYPRLFAVNKLQNDVNHKGSNYTPSLNASSFYFTSSRPVNTSGKTEVLTDKNNEKVVKKESPYLNAVYEVSGDPINEKVAIRKVQVAAKYKEFAAPAFHPDGKTIYITSWTAHNEKKILQVRVSDDSKNWSDPVELGIQVNVKGFSSIQPFVTKDGKYLIFSSNRPGGSGKYDLWYCPLRADGSLGQAVNMGTTINSSEDDQSAYYNNQTNKLIFCSNGRVGMGGFDFYESEGDFTKWSEPRNLGYPFNSSKDDIYFTPSSSANEAYISSDRESICCLEIYHVKKEFLTVQGIILDCNTYKPLSNATVILTDSLEQLKVITDEAGKYNFKINTNRRIKITAEKDKYFSKVINFGYDDLAKKDTLFSPEICLTPFEMDRPIVLKDILYEFDKASLTEDSKMKLDHLYTIMIDNPKIEIELGAHTDSKGIETYNLDLSNRRAKSCVDYLVSKGIDANRMTSRGYGEAVPVAPNELANGKDNPEGRSLNRRTEFKVTKK